MEYTGFFDMRRCGPLPGYDGFIVVELSDRPVKYHIQPTFASSMSARECHTMAMAACRIACNCADAIRGKLSVDHLRRALTHPEIKTKFCYLPTVPTLIDGVITGADTMEMVVFMTIGQEDLRVNLKFRYIGSRWMCVFADLG